MLLAAVLALGLAQPYPPYPPPYPPPPPPPGWRPPPAYAAPAPPPRGQVAIVLLPIGSSWLSSDWTYGQDYASNWHGAAALELRPLHGGGRLRFGFEGSRHDRILDVSLKYNFLDPLPVQPFLEIGVGGANLGPERPWRGTASLGGGVDLFVTRELFIELEAKGRAFTDLSVYDPENVYGTGVRMTVLLAGIGIYF